MMLALTLKIPKTWRGKLRKIAVLGHPTFVSRPRLQGGYPSEYPRETYIPQGMTRWANVDNSAIRWHSCQNWPNQVPTKVPTNYQHSARA